MAYELTESQLRVIHQLQHSHSRAYEQERDFAPTAIYFRKDGTKIGAIVALSTAGDHWLNALTFPIVAVDDVHACVLVVEATKMSEDGVERVLVVVFNTAGGMTPVPIPWDEVGGEIVYGLPDLGIDDAEGEVRDELGRAWTQKDRGWAAAETEAAGFDPQIWPDDPAMQWELTLAAVAACGWGVGTQ